MEELLYPDLGGIERVAALQGRRRETARMGLVETAGEVGVQMVREVHQRGCAARAKGEGGGHGLREGVRPGGSVGQRPQSAHLPRSWRRAARSCLQAVRTLRPDAVRRLGGNEVPRTGLKTAANAKMVQAMPAPAAPTQGPVK